MLLIFIHLLFRNQPDLFRVKLRLIIPFLTLLFADMIPASAVSFTESDSLYRLVKITKSDTAKVDLLIRCSKSELKKDQRKALKYAEEGVQLAKEGNKPLTLINACNQLGIVCNYMSDYPKALEFHMKAMEIAERNKFLKELALSNNLTGGVFYNQEDYDRAGIYFTKALEIREKLDDQDAVAASLNNVGEIYRLKGDNQTALNYYEKAIAINEARRNKIALSINYNNAGNIYLVLNKLPLALENLSKALKNAREACDLETITASLNSMGKYDLKINNTTQALDCFKEALTTSRLIAQKAEEINALKGLSDVNYALKLYKDAMDYYVTYKSRKDSVFNLEKNKKLHEIILRSETAKKEQEILHLEEEHKIATLNASRQHLIILLLVNAIILILATALFLLNRSRLKNRLAVSLEKMVMERTEQLREVNKRLEEFSYVTVHDLRSPLSNLQSLLKLYDNKHAATPENKDILEKIKHSVTHMSGTLSDLMEVLQMGETRDEGKQHVILKRLLADIEESIGFQIKESKARIITQLMHAPTIHYPLTHLKSIILNLLTNAIRYRSPNRDLVIKIKSEPAPGGMICISVEDNGVGFDYEKEKDKLFKLFGRLHTHIEGKGIGLYIMHSMVVSMGGRIEVKSQPDKGTCFSVYLKDFKE
jgi:signal transduction histidine kinase